MKIPKRYEDLTVDQFQKLEELKTNNTLDNLDKAVLRLSILSGEAIEHIESLSPKKVYDYLLDAFFLTKPITDLICPDEIKIGGIKFRYIKDLYDYNICQEKDWKEMVRVNEGNYLKVLPELMAICHQEYENGKWLYNSNNHNRNVELFKQSKLSESLGAVFFYSKSLKTYTKVIADCLAEATQTIEEANQMMMADLEFQTFLNGGDGNTVLA
jgi:hypothetical protein